ncbi:SPOR domain-containing protein [Aerolutibacter ruishenii]|uniref:Cell division septation protein DedD n=1 Tax=Aerolutibacter ruishenii TaxID=686800 RepID=A0A562LKP4_9GAMM|nr:SPOR domain-containing protein [Lysobacter ruishenii]TWI08163.1 cell division septation protein DedD [Lysobacter ruishenii]
MEPALKQRLIGATVLVALAVIFLPMLIKGPAPESGVSDVPLQLPDTPEGDYETRELPLVSPGDVPAGGAVGMDGAAPDKLPTVDADAAMLAPAVQGMMPAPTAGGSHAVTFGSYASAADADRVVAALTASQLPGYQTPMKTASGRTLYRVLIGPYATQAIAESARLRAAHVRDDVAAKVIVLDASAEEVATTNAPASAPASQPVPLASTSVSKPVALGETRSATAVRLQEAASKPTAAASKPAQATPVPVPTPKPAASNVGFAVQLGAFSNTEEATRLRDRARAAGFSAFVESVRTDKGTLSRVRVGPVADRAAADRLQAQVAAKLGVSGIVRPHP